MTYDSEYVKPDGTIELGPECLGIVEFTDDHFEPITSVTVISQSHFHFITPSGKYAYKLVLETEELSYFDNRPYELIHPCPRFAKARLKCLEVYMTGGSDWAEEWDIIDGIEQVYINTNLCPDLKG